jgi:hypothetical protein
MLAGTFQSHASAEDLAARLRDGGLDGLLGGLVTSPLGYSTVKWEDA